jgi:aminodeoxyfutalosine deaminase
LPDLERPHPRCSSLSRHPLPELVAAGVVCSLSTDDPAMFGTDLSTEYAAASELGLEPRSFYEAGLEGALCDEPTRSRLRELGETFDWGVVPSAGVEVP